MGEGGGDGGERKKIEIEREEKQREGGREGGMLILWDLGERGRENC